MFMENISILHKTSATTFQALDDAIMKHLQSIGGIAFLLNIATALRKETLPHETQTINAEKVIQMRLSQLTSKGLVKLAFEKQCGRIGWRINQEPVIQPYQDPHLGFKSGNHSRLRASFGFTLIELMVVLVIIGVLAALIVPNVLDRADDARVTAARTDVSNIMQALKLYKLDNMRYPSAEQGLQALVSKPSTIPQPLNWKPYLEKLPSDPWGRPYQYLNPGIKGEIDVMSFGADGQSGGEGRESDIGSWQ
jgi:general secretion pathway protein G